MRSMAGIIVSGSERQREWLRRQVAGGAKGCHKAMRNLVRDRPNRYGLKDASAATRAQVMAILEANDLAGNMPRILQAADDKAVATARLKAEAKAAPGAAH